MHKSIYSDTYYECTKNPSEFMSIPYIFSGAKKDILLLASPYHCGWATGEVSIANDAFFLCTTPLITVDLIFSTITDTLMLPYTIPKQKKNGNLIDPPYLSMAQKSYEDGDKDNALRYFEKGISNLNKYFEDYADAHCYIHDLDSIFRKLSELYEDKAMPEKAAYYRKLSADLEKRNKHP